MFKSIMHHGTHLCRMEANINFIRVPAFNCTNFPTCLPWHTSFEAKSFFSSAQFHTHICTLFRVVWVFLIGLAVYGALFVGRSQWVRFQASPTVIQLDKNYREWVGTMPAATVCFHNRFDLGRARDYTVRWVINSDYGDDSGFADVLWCLIFIEI